MEEWVKKVKGNARLKTYSYNMYSTGNTVKNIIITVYNDRWLLNLQR